MILSKIIRYIQYIFFIRSEWKTLAGLAHALSPGYIRLGGTKADQVLFKAHLSNHDNIEADEISRSDLLPQDVLIITGKEVNFRSGQVDFYKI